MTLLKFLVEHSTTAYTAMWFQFSNQTGPKPSYRVTDAPNTSYNPERTSSCRQKQDLCFDHTKRYETENQNLKRIH